MEIMQNADDLVLDAVKKIIDDASRSLGLDVDAQWSGILAALKRRSIITWANVAANAELASVEGNVVTVAFSSAAAMRHFTRGGMGNVLASALADTLGGIWRVQACTA